RLDVGDLVVLAAVQLYFLLDLDFIEHRQRRADRLFKGDIELARGLAQPAVAHVVEQDVPLVPQAVLVAHLHPADDAEVHARVDAFRGDLQKGRVVLQRRHLADVFQHFAFAQKRGRAEFADGQYRGRRLELDWRPARRAL